MPNEETHMTGRREGLDKWIITREIPIVWIITLIFNTASMLVVGSWSFAKLDARIAMLEERRIEDKAAAAAITLLPERMLRQEFEVANLKQSINELKTTIQQLQVQGEKRMNYDRNN
jgi:hypothetical protein